MRQFFYQGWIIFCLSLWLSLAAFSAPVIATPLQLPYGEQQLVKPEMARSLIQQARTAWITGDADAFAALFTPDGRFVVPGDQRIGRAAIRQVAADFAASHTKVQIEIRRILVEGNQAVVEWRWQDQDDRTGKVTQAEDAIVVDFEDGYISCWREYIDTLAT